VTVLVGVVVVRRAGIRSVGVAVVSSVGIGVVGSVGIPVVSSVDVAVGVPVGIPVGIGVVGIVRFVRCGLFVCRLFSRCGRAEQTGTKNPKNQSQKAHNKRFMQRRNSYLA
jgi:hypothetical protein